ncbi:hypothetical protein ACU686_31445 [Yinghuangia aomiensis]
MIANGDSNLDTMTSEVPARGEHPPPEGLPHRARRPRQSPRRLRPAPRRRRPERRPNTPPAVRPGGAVARPREPARPPGARARRADGPSRLGRRGLRPFRDTESRDAGSRTAKPAKSGRTPEPASAEGARRPAARPRARRATTPRPGPAARRPGRRVREPCPHRAAACASSPAASPPPSPPAPLRRPDGRAALLARRRRVVVGLFLAFTAGAVLAGLGGMAWLWLPALPGAALTVYIGYLRVQEHRRYEANLRSMRAPAARPPAARPASPRPAARKPEADEPRRSAPAAPRRRPAAEGDSARRPRPTGEAGPPAERPAARPAPEARPKTSRREAEDRDHAEWIAALQTDTADARDRDALGPRPGAAADLRDGPGGPARRAALLEAPEAAEEHHAPPTPLFDQYAEEVLPSIPACTNRTVAARGNE